MVETKPGLNFRRFGFQIIPVEIQILCIRPPSHFFGPILINAIVGSKSFMTVNIKNGNKQYGYMIQNLRLKFCNNHITDQHKTGIFSVRFSGMDTGLNHHHQII